MSTDDREAHSRHPARKKRRADGAASCDHRSVLDARRAMPADTGGCAAIVLGLPEYFTDDVGEKIATSMKTEPPSQMRYERSPEHRVTDQFILDQGRPRRPTDLAP
jgi:hypothetical protein